MSVPTTIASWPRHFDRFEFSALQDGVEHFLRARNPGTLLLRRDVVMVRFHHADDLFGPGTWLIAVQMPAGGAMVSMNPMAASTGALMREAKFTTSKYRAVSMIRGSPEGQLG